MKENVDSDLTSSSQPSQSPPASSSAPRRAYVRRNKDAQRGRKPGAKTWTEQEQGLLVDIVTSLKPIGKGGWHNVAVALNKLMGRNRDDEAAKNRFFAVCSFLFKLCLSLLLQLANFKKPTGDPDLPDTIRKAKQAFFLIEERVAAGSLGPQCFSLSAKSCSSGLGGVPANVCDLSDGEVAQLSDVDSG
jgi:hypothetical protein